MTSENIWRFAAIAEIVTLLVCLGYLHVGFGRTLPRTVYIAGWAYGAVLVAVAVGVLFNVLTSAAPSPGVKVFTGLALTPTLVAVIAATVVVRDAAHRPPPGPASPLSSRPSRASHTHHTTRGA